MLKIITVQVTPIEQNARIIINQETGNAVVVDPGGDIDKIIAALKKENASLQAIWLTHSHYDHCGGVAALKEIYDVPLYAHQEGEVLRSLVDFSIMQFGDRAKDMANCPEPEYYIHNGDILKLDNIEVKVFFTPGHAPGHVVFYQPEEKILLAGDTVFKGSIGRTDFPYGDFELLIKSIRNKILVLDDDVQILCGHGPDTSVGRERTHNQFLKDL